MGHDVVCQLCGVGFGVGRIRTAQEPRGSAWHAYGWSETSRWWVQAAMHRHHDLCFQQSNPSPGELRSGRGHGLAPELENGNSCQIFRRPWPDKTSARNGNLSYAEYNEGAGPGPDDLQHHDGGDEEDGNVDDDENNDEDTNGEPEGMGGINQDESIELQVEADDEREYDREDGSLERSDEVVEDPWLSGVKGNKGSAQNDSENLSEDETYAPSEESEDSEPLDYSSDIDDLAQDSDSDSDHIIRGSGIPWSFSIHEPVRMNIVDTDFELLGAGWVSRRSSYSPGLDDDEDGNHEEDEIDQQEQYDRHKYFEHIAGSNCQREDGYNGHHITANELLYGQTAQFLCTKRSVCAPGENWLWADDDLDFELESDCFLTGLAAAPPYSDEDARLKPTRHGLERIETDNEFYDWAWSTIPRQGLPFHPTCFELFRQMSRVTFDGRTEIDGLMRLRNATCKYPNTWPAKYNEDVKRSTDQSWRCHNGCEYLVANPIYVEALAPILYAAVVAGQKPGFSIQRSAFEARNPALTATVDGDPFLRLPLEVTRCVLDYLGSKDIASMRFASHAFQQLPISLWYRLVRDEMPYLYEAWSDDITPYPWASRLVLECEKLSKVKKEMAEDVVLRQNVIKEDMPQILEEWIKNEKVLTEAELEFHLMSEERRKLLKSTPIKLDLGTTDWYQLYNDIAVSWRLGELKGLRNRARIWENIGQIIDSIRQMKGAGNEYLSMVG